jgi:hypothetical protein
MLLDRMERYPSNLISYRHSSPSGSFSTGLHSIGFAKKNSAGIFRIDSESHWRRWIVARRIFCTPAFVASGDWKM